MAVEIRQPVVKKDV